MLKKSKGVDSKKMKAVKAQALAMNKLREAMRHYLKRPDDVDRYNKVADLLEACGEAHGI